MFVSADKDVGYDRRQHITYGHAGKRLLGKKVLWTVFLRWSRPSPVVHTAKRKFRRQRKDTQTPNSLLHDDMTRIATAKATQRLVGQHRKVVQ